MYLEANIAGMRKVDRLVVERASRPPLHRNVALTRSAKKLRQFLRRVDQDIRRSQIESLRSEAVGYSHGPEAGVATGQHIVGRRSEERRVGKEGRSTRAAYDEKKQIGGV